jgi:hypothetical protein
MSPTVAPTSPSVASMSPTVAPMSPSMAPKSPTVAMSPSMSHSFATMSPFLGATPSVAPTSPSMAAPMLPPWPRCCPHCPQCRLPWPQCRLPWPQCHLLVALLWHNTLCGLAVARYGPNVARHILNSTLCGHAVCSMTASNSHTAIADVAKCACELRGPSIPHMRVGRPGL